MSWFSDGLAWVAGRLTEHFSVPVTYTRGRLSVTFDAVPDLPEDLREDPGAPVKLDAARLAFHFRPELLVLGGVRADPQVGDRLTVGGFVREVYPDQNRPHFERSQVHGHMVLVRTIKVG